jgi:hypothetical protein
MAETINAIAGLCTYQHESKEDFIGRVRAVLGDDPDLRLSIVRKERDELLAALEPFATAFKPAAEQLRKYGASDVMLTHLDRNTVTPTMTMGDFRRAFEAVTGTKCHGQQKNRPKPKLPSRPSFSSRPEALVKRWSRERAPNPVQRADGARDTRRPEDADATYH